jgi:hypothetical protein
MTQKDTDTMKTKKTGRLLTDIDELATKIEEHNDRP